MNCAWRPREQEKRGNQMLSMWWVIAAFLAGGFAGVLVMALMQVAGGLPKQLAQAPDLNRGPGNVDCVI